MYSQDPVFGRTARWFESLPKWSQFVCCASLLALYLCDWNDAPQDGTNHAWILSLVLFVVSLALSILLAPKPNLEDARPAGLGDFQIPTATEGRHVPLIWGTVRQKGPNVVWYGDKTQTAIRKKVKATMTSSTRITTGFRYSLGIQFALCRGADAELTKVWIGDDVVFSGSVTGESRFDIDEETLFGGDELGNGGVQATCDFYPGNTAQTISPYLDTTDRQRVGTAITPTTPRYSGTCYVLAREFTSGSPTSANVGAYIGNSTSIKPWSFEVRRFPPLFTGQAAGENKIGGIDANPVNVIYEILTDTEWGFGFPATDIDLTDFLAAADLMITEANGFSFLLDRQMSAQDLFSELQRQIDCIVFLKQSTGKWTVKTVRDDYDIDLVPQLTDSNVVEIRDYNRGTFQDTTNTITVKYDKRDDDYKLTFALAQDMANAIIQGNGTVSGSNTVTGNLVFPGVKNSALASNLAWRELRTQAYPLATCQLAVNRQMWEVSIGDVVAWTSAKLDFTKEPMRVVGIDYGRLDSNKMTLNVVQDIFQFSPASMGTPPATGWVDPVVTVAAYTTTNILAFESPRAIIVRDPEFAGDDTVSKVHCAARNQAGEVSFVIRQRNAVGTPAGAYSDSGGALLFMEIGELDVALAAGTAIPTSSITINSTPSSQSQLEGAFDDNATDTDLGVSLEQLILVNNEYMLVKSAANSGADVLLQNVYRGVLDSGQFNHAAGDKVYLIFRGAGLSDSTFTNTYNVDIELRMQSAIEVYEGAVTPIGLTMDKRAIRPYLPAAMRYNGTATDYGTPALEGDGSGLDGFGFDVDWLRRRYDVSDELAAMLADDSTVDASTEYRVRVFVDPAGTNTEIASSPTAWATGSGLAAIVNRIELIEIAAAGTQIRVQISVRHDIGAETNLEGRYSGLQDVIPSTGLTGQFYLGGAKAAGDITSSYTALATGTYTVNIGVTFSSQIQYRLNGGSWVNLTGYTAGVSTTGTIAGVTTSDTIELKHLTNPATVRTFLELKNPSAASVAYGTLANS